MTANIPYADEPGFERSTPQTPQQPADHDSSDITLDSWSVDDWDEWGDSEDRFGQGDYELEERNALRRVAGLSTELDDVSEVEYRRLRLERVVLVGVWTEGT